VALAGIDVGTGGCKVTVFREDGKELARAFREYPFIAPRPGWLEIDPENMWQAVKEALREAVSRSPDQLEVMAVTSHGETLVAVDRNGRPVTNALANFDVRAHSYTGYWRERLDPLKIFEITGMPLHGMYTVNKILWLRDNLPADFERSYTFCCVQDFVILRLTGEAVIDPSLAARTMLFDVRKRSWSETMLDQAGVSADSLSRVSPSGTVAGTLVSAVAREVGVKSGVPVACGGHDQPAGLLGCGVRSAGEAMYGMGTSECVAINLGAEPLLSREMMENSFCCYPHVEESSFLTLTYIASGGSVLRWFRDQFGIEEVRRAREMGADPYDILVSEMSMRPASVFFLPHFTGSGTPYLDEKSRGALVGLTLGTTRQECARAVLESLTYEMKVNLDLFERFGIAVKSLRAIGGGSRSERWLRIKADILEKPLVRLSTGEAVGMGTAMLAGKAKGEFSDLQQAVDAMVRLEDRFDPSPEFQEAYRARYQVYQNLYNSLRDISHQVSSLE